MMTNQPLVTIITPCFNGEAFLEEYFQSILKQTYKNMELIFVNDGSNDRTEEIAQKYESIFEKNDIQYLYLYQNNGGQAKAMNTGLKHMTGKYLVWPDSDDLLSSNSIEKRVEFLEKNQEYGLVRSNGYFFDFETKEKQMRISELPNRFEEDIFLDLILEKTYCCCGCYMIRTELLREIYPDLTIYESRAGQNWQILIPMTGRYKCGFIDEDMYYIANRSGSHSRQKRTLEDTVERYLELKKILNKGIALSGRTDRDYSYIVDVKYWKILFYCYMNAGAIEQGKKYYQKLKKINEVGINEKEKYLMKVHPLKYKGYQIANFLKRGIRKVMRIIKMQ